MKKSTLVLLHIGFWGLFAMSMIFNALIVKVDNEFIRILDDYGKLMSYLSLFSPAFFYLGYWVVMKLIKKKKLLFYCIAIVFLFLLFLYIGSKAAFIIVSMALPRLIWWLFMGYLFRFFVDWFKKKQNILMLEKENVESQLALLKAQINPHFLFNTLHNIDSLIIEKPESASKSLVKLSDIMRYMLRDGKNEMVPIEKEIQYIEDYIALEKLRLKNEKFLSFSIKGDYSDKKVASLLFIPFIENAFKHSVDSNIENGISIRFVFSGDTLTFSCDNKFDEATAEKDNTHGIGLDTVKKRLHILYPHKHKLSLNKENSIFKVKLEISLNEN